MSALRGVLTFVIAASAGCSLFVETASLEVDPATKAGQSEGGVDERPGHAEGGVDERPGEPTGSDGGSTPAPGNVAGGNRYVAAVLADKPLVYLRLGERSGILAEDFGGHGTDGAYLGAVTHGIPGALAGDTDTAVRFGTKNWDAEKVRVVAPFDFANVAPFTLEAWVKPEAAVDGAFNGIVGRYGWSLFMQHEVVKFQRVGPENAWDGPWFTTALPHDRFTHVVGTFDGSVMHLYIDSLDVGQGPSTRMLPASTEPVFIGAHFPGSIDELAIYDHALTAERVRAHYKSGRPE